MSEKSRATPCPFSTGFVGVVTDYVVKIFILMDDILKVLEANKDKIFTAEELVRELPKERLVPLEMIRDAMWLLDQQGKAKLWVRLP